MRPRVGGGLGDTDGAALVEPPRTPSRPVPASPSWSAMPQLASQEGQQTGLSLLDFLGNAPLLAPLGSKQPQVALIALQAVKLTLEPPSFVLAGPLAGFPAV